jgi:hypothetical protein
MTFQVVDMRWGVRDEATDDHMTTELCMREIANCQRLSMGPNFVVSSFTGIPIVATVRGSDEKIVTVINCDVTYITGRVRFEVFHGGGYEEWRPRGCYAVWLL